MGEARLYRHEAAPEGMTGAIEELLFQRFREALEQIHDPAFQASMGFAPLAGLPVRQGPGKPSFTTLVPAEQKLPKEHPTYRSIKGPLEDINAGGIAREGQPPGYAPQLVGKLKTSTRMPSGSAPIYGSKDMYIGDLMKYLETPDLPRRSVPAGPRKMKEASPSTSDFLDMLGALLKLYSRR